jgi:hypothetical protein
MIGATTHGTLPDALLRRVGAAPPLPGEETPEPTTNLDWALRWQERGLYLFPCKPALGLPIPEKWWSKASKDRSIIVDWWNEHKDADIAVVPERSNHFVISAVGEAGQDSLAALEEEYGPFNPEFEYENRWGSRHLWILNSLTGHALSSHDLLGKGIHVFGAGTYVYLPPSVAPDAYEGNN